MRETDKSVTSSVFMKQGIDGCEKDSSMEETRVTTDRVMRRAGDSSYE